MSIYYFIYFLSIPFNFLNLYSNKFKKLNLIYLALLIFFIGFRFESDIDFNPYLDLFNEVPSINIISFEDIRGLYGEPLFLIFISLFKFFGFIFSYFLFLIAFLSIAIKYKYLNKLSNAGFIALICYLGFHQTTIEFIQFRWAFSVACIFAFYVNFFTYKKNAYIYAIIAIGFHYYSLIFILIGFFYRISVKLNSRKKILLIILIFILIFLTYEYTLLSNNIYLIDRFNRYFNNPSSHVGLFSYAKIFIMIFLVFIGSRIGGLYIDNLRDLRNISYLLQIYSLISSIVPIFHSRAVVLADLISIAVYFGYTSKNKYKLIYFFIMIIFSYLWYFEDVKISYSELSIYDYKNIIFN